MMVYIPFNCINIALIQVYSSIVLSNSCDSTLRKVYFSALIYGDFH